ncbi:hypothetical protein CPTAKMssTn_145 [Salmonella phage vB_SenM-AKM_ssTn]|nr:hypothetical protein CPTAKMssTn_145 [Salmonella phage vB_SenM-AKM_ssTn]
MSGQDSNSLPFSELTILCNPLLIKPFILLARVRNRTTLLSATPCHQCTTSPSICRNLRIRPRPVGVLLNPGRSAGTMNQVNSTNRNPLVAL